MVYFADAVVYFSRIGVPGECVPVYLQDCAGLCDGVASCLGYLGFGGYHGCGGLIVIDVSSSFYFATLLADGPTGVVETLQSKCSDIGAYFCERFALEVVGVNFAAFFFEPNYIFFVFEWVGAHGCGD